jgi:TonB family protein
MATPLTLKVFKDGALVASQDFTRDIIKIGRLSSAHLRLDDEKVSRVHSVIEVAADGSLSIIDMGSVEGTYVNGKRVNKGRISIGDEIRVGGTTLRLESPAAVAAVNLSAAVSSTEVATQAPVATPAVEAPLASVLAQAAVEAAPVEIAPRVRTVSRGKASGPLGVSLRFLWGNQRVGEFFLPPGVKRSFSVGSAAGVDFVMGDSRLGSPRLEVLRTDGQTYSVFFTGKMKGALTRGDETLDLQAVIESGRASHEGEAYALALETDDLLSLDLGGVTLEACFQPVPRRVHVPLADSVDYRALNILLLMLFASSMFVISATNRGGDDEAFADELNSNQERLAKLIIKAPEPKKNPLLVKLNEQKATRQTKRGEQRTPEAQPKPQKDPKPARQAAANPSRPNKAQDMVKGLFGGPGKGVTGIFAPGMNNDLRNAIGNVRVAANSPGGIGGMDVKVGPGGPGGPGNTIGLGGLFTPGRSGGNNDYGSKVGPLTGKQTTDIVVDVDDIDSGATIDKELVRKVIHDNRRQIRTCYEELLNQYPNLGGKVTAQFVIGPTGKVLSSKVAQSTAGNKQLETCVASRVQLWQFPAPKGGGSAVVTYPFIFKQSGG